MSCDKCQRVDRVDRVDRRAFLAQAALLGIGASVAASCGDGVFGAPNKNVTPLQPILALSSQSISFVADASGTQLASQQVMVTRAGDRALEPVTVAIAPNDLPVSDWLSVEVNSTRAPMTITLTARRGTRAAGMYGATIIVSASGAASQSVAVALIVQDINAPPSLALSTTAVAFSGMVGLAPASQLVRALNTGGGTITELTRTIRYENGEPGWLDASIFDHATTPATLALVPETSAMPTGTYVATIDVRGSGTDSRTLIVTLVVEAEGLRVVLAEWPTLGHVGGVVGSVGQFRGRQIAVSRASTTTFLAFSLTCPHEGATVQVLSGASFRCPGHGALFDNAGSLQPNSPQVTSNLSMFRVRYTPDASDLFVY